MEEYTSNNRPKNCFNNGLAIRHSIFSLIERIHNPSRTYVNVLRLYALHSSAVIGLSTGFFTLCEKAVFTEIKAGMAWGCCEYYLASFIIQDQLRIIQTQSCSRRVVYRHGPIAIEIKENKQWLSDCIRDEKLLSGSITRNDELLTDQKFVKENRGEGLDFPPIINYDRLCFRVSSNKFYFRYKFVIREWTNYHFMGCTQLMCHTCIIRELF